MLNEASKSSGLAAVVTSIVPTPPFLNSIVETAVSSTSMFAPSFHYNKGF